MPLAIHPVSPRLLTLTTFLLALLTRRSLRHPIICSFSHRLRGLRPPSCASCLTPLAICGLLLLPACQTDGLTNAQALQALASEPLNTQTWYFGQQPATLIKTPDYRIFTTIDDPIYQHLLVHVLEGAHARAVAINPHGHLQNALDAYVFASRGQWEAYTRARAGSNAPTYLQITAGGYCQDGVFAGYDIGRARTLSVIAHEAWHQYSWFAFKNRLPSWLEEGLATQNEAIDWDGTTPVFQPERNYDRFLALKQANHENRLWSLADLTRTHAGQVLQLPQKRIDAYYAQVWGLVLFLQHSPIYQPRLINLLSAANAGTLTASLSGVSQAEIDNFTEHWNAVAGPTYLQKYIAPNPAELERQYRAWITQFTSSWPPKL